MLRDERVHAPIKRCVWIRVPEQGHGRYACNNHASLILTHLSISTYPPSLPLSLSGSLP
jgi:hypothetical protein